MSAERASNAARNAAFGFILNVYQILIPFIMRSCMIYYMGLQYLGLNGLFSSVLQVLNMAELGVGSAVLFSLYKPIAEGDTKRICALLKLFRKYYTIIGCTIATLGLILTPFISYFIKGDIPQDINVYIIYLLNLLSTVVTYLFFAYRNVLFNVHQRVDITHKVTLIMSSITYLIQFLCIIVIKNYYMYLVVGIVMGIGANIVVALLTRKCYPQYRAIGEIDADEKKAINNHIKDLITSKVGGTILLSADAIVISAFLGLTELAVYQNYFFIISAVTGVVEMIFTACLAGIGNSLVVESKDKNYNDFKIFNFLIFAIAAVGCCCFLNMFQPFMKIWVGEDNMLKFSAVICFCVYFYFFEINRLLNTYKDAAGIWNVDKWRPLLTSLANLTMNIVMVQFWGIYGVILSTVIATLLIGIPWCTYNLFSTVFYKKQLKQFVIRNVLYVIVVLLVSVISFILCIPILGEGFGYVLLRMVICISSSILIVFLIFVKTTEFKQCLGLICNVLHIKKQVGR